MFVCRFGLMSNSSLITLVKESEKTLGYFSIITEFSKSTKCMEKIRFLGYLTYIVSVALDSSVSGFFKKRLNLI